MWYKTKEKLNKTKRLNWQIKLTNETLPSISLYWSFKALVSHLWHAGCMQPGTAVNMAQHQIVNLLKTLWDFFVIACCDVFNVRHKATLLPVWHRDAQRLDIHKTEVIKQHSKSGRGPGPAEHLSKSFPIIFTIFWFRLAYEVYCNYYSTILPSTSCLTKKTSLIAHSHS